MNILTANKPINLAAIVDQAERAKSIVAQVRSAMLAPTEKKLAPTFTPGKLMALTGLDRSQLDYRLRKGDLPQGKLNANGTRREFTLAEARVWSREIHKDRLKPEGGEAIVIATGNFKGGVSKTTTTLTLAQGLSQRGHNVLVIDCDPQASLTTLFGLLPDSEVEVDDTLLPLLLGEQSDLSYAIKPTYWDGIDLVAAASFLFSAEFALPAKQSQDARFEFWNVLNYGLDPVRDRYDFILLDTAPSLSYGTINALMASDGIIMPLPPNALDFASSVQFWDLFSDLTTQILGNRGSDKEFAFIDILLSKVDASDQASSVVREWIAGAYAEKVIPVEIPKTAATSASSAEFGTIYDSVPSQANTRTFKRAFEAYDRFVELIEDQTQQFWQRQKGA